MENDNTTKNQGGTPGDFPPRTPKKQTRKERSKTKQTSEEAKKHQKHTLWRNWKSRSRTRQLELLFAGLVAIGGVSYLGVAIWGNLQTKWTFQAEHRPIVVHHRPPALLDPMSCDALHGQLNLGRFEVAVKNIGNMTAYNVFPLQYRIAAVPEHKIGDPIQDEPPSVTERSCSDYLTNPKIDFPLGPGQEKYPQDSQGVVTISPRLNGDTVQVYFSECVYYVNGGHHGTCDVYRLFVPSANSLIGTPNMICDGKPITGTFVETPSGHCQN
jgi:hypothetical protein